MVQLLPSYPKCKPEAYILFSHSTKSKIISQLKLCKSISFRFFPSALFCMLQNCNQISLQSYLGLCYPCPNHLKQCPQISIGTTPNSHTTKPPPAHHEGQEMRQRIFLWQLLKSTHNSQTTQQVIGLELKCNKATKVIS